MIRSIARINVGDLFKTTDEYLFKYSIHKWQNYCHFLVGEVTGFSVHGDPIIAPIDVEGPPMIFYSYCFTKAKPFFEKIYVNPSRVRRCSKRNSPVD